MQHAARAMLAHELCKLEHLESYIASLLVYESVIYCFCAVCNLWREAS